MTGDRKERCLLSRTRLLADHAGPLLLPRLLSPDGQLSTDLWSTCLSRSTWTALVSLTILGAVEAGTSGPGTTINQRMDLLLRLNMFITPETMTAKLTSTSDILPSPATTEFLPALKPSKTQSSLNL